jgi:hypothetical protein
MQPSNIFGGFWFFVYGLMVYLPANSIPPAEMRGATKPRFRHYIIAVILPLISPIMLLPLAPLLRYSLICYVIAVNFSKSFEGSPYSTNGLPLPIRLTSYFSRCYVQTASRLFFCASVEIPQYLEFLAYISIEPKACNSIFAH